MLTTAQIMTTDVVTISSTATIQDAIELLVRRRISGLPVIGPTGQLVGIITEFALLAMAYDQDLQDDPIERHMTRDVITVDSSDSISRATDLFILHRVRRLPVVEGGRLVGLLSRHDILNALISERAPVCTA
ncbi:Inosine-5'-monophosphate dehydrogenase [Posidoniimonas polymericola]|uniref:Inosine-5'-monophosphate dehydrogenase n=1 Tax=Posidoniimonas polymericola TaxID=2528002 RepID=A0A5C5XTT3_9BACT|nr:CBS domain-containing protein [Posidoniimonas polymericola]TWT66294.1 Inosine-5'-monophosphate dehydrogenase [Posidoniimonas polymericola]